MLQYRKVLWACIASEAKHAVKSVGVRVMKKNHKIWKSAACLLAAMTCAVSCSGLSSSDGLGTDRTADAAADTERKNGDAVLNDTSAGYENCTLTISWWGGEARHDATLQALEVFEEKYPGIFVESTYGAWNGWEDKMAQAFSDRTAEDVIQINWNWIMQYGTKKAAFLNLDNCSGVIDLTGINKKWLDLCRAADGSLAGIPVSVTGRIFYWDTTTFDEAGIEIPSSAEELFAAGEAFCNWDASYYPLAMGAYDRMIFLVYYLESVYGKDWVSGNSLNYTEEQIAEGLSFLKSMEDAHVMPTLSEMEKNRAASLDQDPNWMDGHYAGIFEWDSSADKFAQAANGREIAVGDYFRDFGEFQGGFAKVSMAWAISADTEHPKEAALLVDFLLNDEEAAKILTSQRGIPVSSSALDAAEDKMDPLTVAANQKVLSWVSNSLDSHFEDISLKSSDGLYSDVMAGLSDGTYTPKEAAGILAKGIRDALQ